MREKTSVFVGGVSINENVSNAGDALGLLQETIRQKVSVISVSVKASLLSRKKASNIPRSPLNLLL